MHKDIYHATKEIRKGFLWKFDFKNACDRVNWERLIEVIRSRRFGPKLMGWIKIWLYLTKTNIIYNCMVRRRPNGNEGFDKETHYPHYYSH